MQRALVVLVAMLWASLVAADERFDSLLRAAEGGDAEAQFNLGVEYSNGTSVPKDRSEAVKWWRKAAEQGDVRSELWLGLLYKYGSGVPQDYSEAMKWYRRAAEQGDTTGQACLANMYDDRPGVQHDYVQAHMWFNLASTKVPSFAAERDRVAAKMTPAQIAEAQRLAREWKPTKP